MSIAQIIDAIEVGNEAAAKLNARKAFPDYAADMGRAYNGSIDAAKRLHDALLPGWWAMLRHSSRPSVTVGYVDGMQEAQDDSLSRAWLLCVLRAIEDTP